MAESGLPGLSLTYIGATNDGAMRQTMAQCGKRWSDLQGVRVLGSDQDI